MRTLELFNSTETSSVVLTSKTAEIKGLGTKVKLLQHDTTYYGFEEGYEPIVLKLVFGINSNAYTDYKALADFIAANGQNKLVLKYSYSGTYRYCDVWFDSLTKTEKTQFNVLEETIIFQRITPYYEKVSTAYTSAGSVTITNSHWKPINLDFDLYDGTGSLSNFIIYLKTTADVEVSRISVTISVATPGAHFYIKASSKKIYKVVSSVQTDAYDTTNKTYKSFLQIPQGSYKITYPIVGGTGASTTITYKKWVSD